MRLVRLFAIGNPREAGGRPTFMNKAQQNGQRPYIVINCLDVIYGQIHSVVAFDQVRPETNKCYEANSHHNHDCCAHGLHNQLSSSSRQVENDQHTLSNKQLSITQGAKRCVVFAYIMRTILQKTSCSTQSTGMQ